MLMTTYNTGVPFSMMLSTDVFGTHLFLGGIVVTGVDNTFVPAPELDIHAVTGVLKEYLRDLPDKVLTAELHHSFIECAAAKDVNGLALLVANLPQVHYKTLEMVITLCSEITAHSGVNLMTATNLGVVFGPTLMAGAAMDGAQLLMAQYDGKAVKSQNDCISLLIEHKDAIFVEEKGKEKWQWMNAKGWEDYPESAQAIIAKARSEKARTVKLALGNGRSYIIDFKIMRQYQESDHMLQRVIRFVEIFDRVAGGGGGGAAAPGTPVAKSPSQMSTRPEAVRGHIAKTGSFQGTAIEDIFYGNDKAGNGVLYVRPSILTPTPTPTPTVPLVCARDLENLFGRFDE